jgi:hypothetical protein
MTHWVNPWKDAIPASLEELAECTEVGNWTSADSLHLWRGYGSKLDPYILDGGGGRHCIGIRFGNKGEEYLSPYAPQDKIHRLLLRKRIGTE